MTLPVCLSAPFLEGVVVLVEVVVVDGVYLLLMAQLHLRGGTSCVSTENCGQRRQAGADRVLETWPEVPGFSPGRRL